MKEIKKYVAIDGKEFDCKEDCKNYELTIAMGDLKMWKVSGVPTKYKSEAAYIYAPSKEAARVYDNMPSSVKEKNIEYEGLYMCVGDGKHCELDEEDVNAIYQIGKEIGWIKEGEKTT